MITYATMHLNALSEDLTIYVSVNDMMILQPVDVFMSSCTTVMYVHISMTLMFLSCNKQ